MSNNSPEKRTARVGEISGVHGVKGWVKIYSETSPQEKIFEYQPWQLVVGQGGRDCKPLEWRRSGKALIAQIEGIEDRDQAMALVKATIEVDIDQFDPLQEGEYYWFQLQGLQVDSLYEGSRTHLGKVTKMMETGANDVLVVHSDDGQERLVPWTPGEHILRVDLQAGQIEVDWDPDF